MAEIEVDHVKKSYGDVNVIREMSLSISDGEFVVLVGPSGCGKSTLLRMIAGLEEITGGEIRINGARVNEVTAAERGLAMVFQSYALYPHMSVFKNMAFGLENTRMPRPEIDKKVRHAAELLQITPYLNRKPGALSGGQRQRVAIGRAIVRDPVAFLFDEPLSNLDAELRVAMRKELAALHANIGGTMIYVTHDQVEAMTLADKIVVLRGGNIEQIGAPLDLYNTPANQFVAGFIGSPRMNFLEGQVADRSDDSIDLDLVGGHKLSLTGRNWPVGAGDTLTLGVRPEHFEIVDDGDGLPLEVDLSEQLGGESYFYCSLEKQPQITIHQPGQWAVGRNEKIRVRPRVDMVHFFDGQEQVIVPSN